MKLKNFHHYVIIALAMSLFSCSKDNKALSVVPKDAEIVGKFNVASLFKKSNISSDENQALLKKLGAKNTKDYQILEGIMKDPSSACIDFTKDMLFFAAPKNTKLQYFAISMVISDAEKFEKTFLEISKNYTSVDKPKPSIQNYKDLKYVATTYNQSFIWGKEKAIFMVYDYDFQTKAVPELTRLMEIKEEESIAKNERFMEFYSKTSDAGFWFSTNYFKDNDEIKDVASKLKFDPLDNNICAFLNFENGNANMNFDLQANESLKKYLAENNTGKGKFNADLLESVPSTDLAMMSFSFDTEQVIKELKESKDFQSQAGMMGTTIIDYVSALGGSFAVSVFDVKIETKKVMEPQYSTQGESYEMVEVEKMDAMPLALLTFDHKDEKKFTDLFNQFSMLFKKEDNFFVMENEFSNAYIRVLPDRIVATNSKEKIKELDSKGALSNNVSKSDFNTKVEANNFFLYNSLDYDKMPENFKKYIDSKYSNYGKEQLKQLQLSSKYLKSNTIELGTEDAIWNLNFKDDSKNSLEQLFQLFAQSAELVQ
jgi:hypothetical protein